MSLFTAKAKPASDENEALAPYSLSAAWLLGSAIAVSELDSCFQVDWYRQIFSRNEFDITGLLRHVRNLFDWINSLVFLFYFIPSSLDRFKKPAQNAWMWAIFDFFVVNCYSTNTFLRKNRQNLKNTNATTNNTTFYYYVAH